MSARRLAVGRSGERLVARAYQRRGYRVVARNWRHGRGELDLVVTDGRVLVICEVKARTTASHGTGFDAVGEAKQRQIRKLTVELLRELRWSGAFRFDVASVVAGRIDLIEDAF